MLLHAGVAKVVTGSAGKNLQPSGYRFVAPVERSIGEISEASGRARLLLRTVSPKRLGLGLALLAVVGVIYLAEIPKPLNISLDLRRAFAGGCISRKCG